MTKLAAVPASKSLYMSGVPLYTVSMTVAEFLAIQRCPFQRNEELRLNKPHLRVLAPQHALVAIAVLPDGRTMIVDGHTRKAKWIEGSLGQPAGLVVAVYSVKTLDEVEAIYESYDASEAVKNGTDKVQSGLSRAGLELKTPWLAAGGMTAALELACVIAHKSKPKKKTQVELFAKELALFDTIEPNRTNFLIGFGAAALLILRKHGALGLDFLKNYNANLGNKVGEERDAVQMLTEFLVSERAARTTGLLVNNKRHVSMMLALHTRHIGGKMHKRLPRPTDLATYC